jgi:hypothetical protein
MTDEDVIRKLREFAEKRRNFGFPQSQLTCESAVLEIGSVPARQQTLIRERIAHWNRRVEHFTSGESPTKALCGFEQSNDPTLPFLDGFHSFIEWKGIAGENENTCPNCLSCLRGTV